MASPTGEKWLDVYDTPYSNGSNTVANAFFLGLVCMSLVGCLAATWRTQRCIPFSFVMCEAYVFEISAYALRFQSWDYARFSTEVGLFTIAPVFLTIGIHLSTAQVLTTLGVEHAPLSPKAYLRLFIWTDVVCLLLQGTGLGLTFSGARAAGPWGLLLQGRGHTGQTVVFVGLLVQTLSLAGALALLAVTYVRAGRGADRDHGYTAFQQPRGRVPLGARAKAFLVVLPLAGACVLVRCAYRTAAAWGGLLGGAVARGGVLWLVAEGTLLTEAMVTLAVFHPALWLVGDDYAGGGGGGGGNRRQYGGGDDVEGGGGRWSSVVGGGMAGKRLSSGTTLTAMADAEEVERRERESRPDLAEMSQLMFASNLIALSDAGSSDRSGSRRGSAGERVLNVDPYYRYEESPYDLGRRYSQDITAETRGLSPMEAEAEDERLETESFIILPPRKSSKRQNVQAREDEEDRLEVESFVLPPRKSSKRQNTWEREDDEDRLEVESFVLPPRKSSKRETIRGREEDLDSVSLYSQ